MSGQNAVAGAAVQIYAAGTTGNGSAPIALLAAALTTDAYGTFTVPSSFTCPASSLPVYVIASGGQVGTGSANQAIKLLNAIGACDQITASSGFIVNEVTTVAATWALSQFMTAAGNIGASSTNAQGLSNAFATVASLANPIKGTAPGANFPANGQSPASKINTLANVLNACTSSSGSSNACSTLFSTATASGSATPSDTLGAVFNIVRNAGNNVATLYSLSTASAIFQPALTKAPSDWTLFVTFTGGGMDGPGGIAADSSGNLWVASYFGVVTAFSPTGALLFPNGITGYGLNDSYGIAIDSQNNIWIPNEGSPSSVNKALGSVTELNSSGQPLSGTNGYSAGGLNYPISIAVDTNGTYWVADYGNANVTLLNSSGQPVTGFPGYIPPATSGVAFPVAVIVDGGHNAWIANQGTSYITRISASTGKSADVQCCNGPNGLAIDQQGYIWVSNYYGDSVSQISSTTNAVVSSGYTGGGLAHPGGIAIDGAGNVWVANFRSPGLTELAGSASSTPGQALSPAAGWAPESALLEAFGIAIDASGNLWVTSFGNNLVTEFIGLASPVKTPGIVAPQAP